MNELTKFLVESVIGTEFDKYEKTVALFGGGFKPPTKGHLEVVNQGIKRYPEVTEVKILVGGKERNGFTQDQAVKIWNLYNDVGFINKPADIKGVENPITSIRKYIKDNPNDKVVIFVGSREENKEDQKDVIDRRRIIDNAIKKHNLNPKNITFEEISTTGGVSGTLARELFKTDLNGFKNMFPENLLDQDFDKILDILNGKSADTTQKPASTKTEPLSPKEENIDPKSQKKHKGKSAPFGSAYEPLNENATYSSKIDYKQQIKDLTKHMLKKGMNILPLPRVIFKHGDQENASQFLGKTTYYSPSDMTVVLYTEGRHPKDIVRSFAHEMVHHIQNLEGRLGGINTTNTQEDDNLNDIEREAYTKGNMTFRNWTDSKDGEEVTSLNEKIVGEKIECDNCGWSWNIVDGGDDLFICHKCDYDNEIINEEVLPQEKFAQETGKDWAKESLRIVDLKNYDLENYTIKILPLESVKPTQFGEDYINASSEYEAEVYDEYLKGEIEARDVRKEDFYPIVVDKDTMEILDGNHRHAVHTMLNLPKIKTILISKKLNEKKNKDPFGLKAYARELVNETFKKSVTIDMDVVNAALEDGVFTDKETDESVIAIIDAAPQGKVPHPVFLDFYAKYDKYFGEENDKRVLDEFGLKQILTNVLNLPKEDIQTVINHYNTTDQDSVEWFEQHDNEEEKEEEFNIPGFNSSQDDYETVVNYRKQQLAKSLEEQERVRIFPANCECDKT